MLRVALPWMASVEHFVALIIYDHFAALKVMISTHHGLLNSLSGELTRRKGRDILCTPFSKPVESVLWIEPLAGQKWPVGNRKSAGSRFIYYLFFLII